MWVGKDFDNFGNVIIMYGIIGIGDCGDFNLIVEGMRWGKKFNDIIGYDLWFCVLLICYCVFFFYVLRLIDILC